MAIRVNQWDKTFNIVYSIGASIVILGVIGKLAHTFWGDYVLYLGLIVEAVIFFASAFDTPTNDYVWRPVYPEFVEDKPSDILLHPHSKPEKSSAKSCDKALPPSSIDPNLSEQLCTGIEQLGKTAEILSKNAEALCPNQQYETQLSRMSQHLASINTTYKNQSELIQRQFQINEDMLDQLTQTIENAKQLNLQMHTLSNKLASLNKVYSGMLSAMQNNPEAS